MLLLCKQNVIRYPNAIFYCSVVKIIQGGAVAAPTGGKILSEVLPYMEIKKEEEAKEYESVPNVVRNDY